MHYQSELPVKDRPDILPSQIRVKEATSSRQKKLDKLILKSKMKVKI